MLDFYFSLSLYFTSVLLVNAEMQEAIYKTIIEVLEKILSDVYIYLTINAQPLGFYALNHCSSYCPRIIKLYRSCYKTILFNGKYSVSCRFGVRDST